MGAAPEQEPRQYQRHGIGNKSLTISVPGKLREMVKIWAAHRNTTVSAIVTAAITAYLMSGDDEERVA